jgi:uncharacterized protein YbdZ (MbtH family)
MTADYVYPRLDGGTTLCYGVVEEDSNFSVVCSDEDMDGIWAGDIDFVPTDWKSVCQYLEQYYYDQIEELESC